MSDSGPYVDPRAAEILCDVIRDPKATLLRMKNARTFAPTVAGGGAELLMPSCMQTSAEKELLRLYREETAYLLRLAYHKRALMPRKEKELGLIYIEAGEQGPGLAMEEILERARFLEDWSKGRIAPSVDLAVRAIRDSGTRMMDLACLSARFAPSAQAESYIVEEFILAEEGASAVVACERGLVSSMTAVERSKLVSKQGVAYSLCGNYFDAAACLRVDVLDGAPREFSALNWALQACKCGDSSGLREALAFLDDNWGSPTPKVDEWIRLSQLQLSSMEPTVDRSSAKLARAMLPSAGAVGAELLNLAIFAGPTW